MNRSRFLAILEPAFGTSCVDFRHSVALGDGGTVYPGPTRLRWWFAVRSKSEFSVLAGCESKVFVDDCDPYRLSWGSLPRFAVRQPGAFSAVDNSEGWFARLC